MNRNSILIICIHTAQIERAIFRAKRLGAYVIVGDKSENLKIHSKLLANADELIEIDWEDYYEMLEKVKRLIKRCHGLSLISFNENALQNVALVIKELSLLGNSDIAVNNCKDKYNTKRLLKLSNIPVVEFMLCESTRDVEKFIDKHKYPIVLKPRKQKGSIGVVKVDKYDNIKNAFQKVMENNGNLSSIIAERFINGQEVSIEAVLYNGDVHIWGITEKLLFKNTFVESGHITPYISNILTEDYAKAITRRVVDILGITTGPLHIEGFLIENTLYIGEVHTRYGGDNITTITELSRDCDIHTPVFAELLNINYVIPDTYPYNYCGIKYFDVEPGKIKAIEGVNELKLNKNVISYFFDCKVKDVVNKFENSYDRKGWYIVEASSREEIIKTMRQLENIVKIITE